MRVSRPECYVSPTSECALARCFAVWSERAHLHPMSFKKHMSLRQLLFFMQASSTDKLKRLSRMSPNYLGLTLVSNTRCQSSNGTLFLPHKKSRNIIFDCGVVCPKFIRLRYRRMKQLDGTWTGSRRSQTTLMACKKRTSMGYAIGSSSFQR